MQVCFSYSESLRTPPLQGNSLHRRNNSAKRPWGILSLFTTYLLFCVKSSYQSRCRMSPDQRPGWKMAQDRSVNKSHSEERKEPYNTLNRTEQHRKRTEWKKATEKKREQTKHSNEKEPYKSAKKNSRLGQTAWWKKTSAKSLKEVLTRESSHTKY